MGQLPITQSQRCSTPHSHTASYQPSMGAQAGKPAPEPQSSGSGSVGGAAACPMKQPSSGSSSSSGYKNEAQFNVYSQRLNDPAAPPPVNPLAVLRNSGLVDPSNNMPLEPNQTPCPGQRKHLSTDRQPSIIPKGGTDNTWLFPSPQMVFNALKRKGKGDDVVEDDMNGFISAHNSMNEATWQQVALWERLHAHECANPTLLRFMGKPHDLSPLARVRSLFGGPMPFDRHDWTVDRCGKEVRYVIDFYFYDDKAGTPEAFEMVTRPALDSVEAGLDRVKMAIYTRFAEWGLPCPVTGTPGSIGAEAAKS